MDKVTIIFNNTKEKKKIDIEVPLDITANELIKVINEVFDLKMDLNDKTKCYLKAEKPIVLLKGNKTLQDLGIHNGTIISL